VLNGRVGVGVIGASPGKGWASTTHVPAIRSVPDLELVAISTSRKASAEEAKRQFAVPFAFDDSADLIAHDAVDLVVVSVRVPRHFELVSAAIEARKAVLCEWPLGNGLDEALRLEQMARDRDVRNWVGLQLRASPVVNRIRDLVREGFIGEVLSTTVVGSGLFWGGEIDREHAFIFDRRNGVTPLTISFAHRVDALCYCLGEFAELSAIVANRRTAATVIETGESIAKTAEDQLVVAGTLESGAVASIHYRGGTSRGVNLLWEINGTEGDLQIVDRAGHGHDPDLQLWGARRDDNALQALKIPAQYFQASASAAPGFAYNVAQQYMSLARDWRDWTHGCPTFHDAVVRHRLLDAIERASASGHRESYTTR